MSDTLCILLGVGADGDAPLSWARLDREGKPLAGGADLAAAGPDQVPRGLACRALVACDRLLFARVTPVGGRLPRGRTLAYALEDQLAVDPDGVHAVAGAPAADGSAWAAVVDQAFLRGCLTRLGRLGWNPARVGVEIDGLPAEAATWHLAWSPRPYLRMQTPPALALAPSEALTWLQLALEQADPPPQRLVVHAAAGMDLPDLEAWSTTLGLPVETGATYDWTAAARTRAGWELLQGDLARTPAWLPDRRHVRPLVGLGLALVLVHGLGFLAQAGSRVWEARQLSRQSEALFREAFPEARVVVDAPLQMRRKLDELRRAAGQPVDTDFAALLGRAGLVLDPAQRQAVTGIRYGQGRLHLAPVAGPPAPESWARVGLRAVREPGGAGLAVEVLP